MSDAYAALNRLTKWRSIFAGWQLGTRPKGDPECDAVRDHREVTMMLRAEVNALITVLVEHNILTENEWLQRLGTEAELLSVAYSKKFPGMTATDEGIDMKLPEAHETMKGWRP